MLCNALSVNRLLIFSFFSKPVWSSTTMVMLPFILISQPMALYAFNTVMMSPFVTTFPRNSALRTAVISAPLIQKCLSHCSSINNCSLKNRLSLQSPLSPSKDQTAPLCASMLHHPNSKRQDTVPWIIIQRFTTVLQAVRPFRCPQLQHYSLNTYNSNSEWSLGIC